MRPFALILLAAALPTSAPAQFQIQDSHTTASLRGIHALGNGVAWASGTQGTVLRTTDDGTTWQTCATPPDAEKLDFRGIQAFDDKTALVMSSGKGNLSRLYKTADACKSWQLVFTNPDKEGFWDAMQIFGRDGVGIVGDAVTRVSVSDTTGRSDTTMSVIPVWSLSPVDRPTDSLGIGSGDLPADPNEGGFAASNSTLALGASPHRDPVWVYRWLATQTADHSYVHRKATEETKDGRRGRTESLRVETPMSQGSTSAGIFSLSFREDLFGVAVGGDYRKPEATVKTASYSDDTGKTWNLAQTQPHGYRSAVAYDPKTNTWITVGPSGTDISTDDGKNWHALKPSSSEPKEADKNWNALSLPFVVGPKGRIGRLNPTALKPAALKPAALKPAALKP